MWKSSGRPEAVAAGGRACWWWAVVGSAVVADNDDFVAAGEDVGGCDDAGPLWSLTNSYSTIYTPLLGPGEIPEAISFVIYQIRSRHCTGCVTVRASWDQGGHRVLRWGGIFV